MTNAKTKTKTTPKAKSTSPDLDKILVQIRNADHEQVQAQFTIANLLTAVKDHHIYELGGYKNFMLMVRAELDFAPSTAMKYVSMYNGYVRLRYTKNEFLKLMQQFGWRRVEEAMRGAKTKIGHRGMQAFMLNRGEQRSVQFNFNVTDKNIANKLEHLLARFGLEIKDGGTRSHLTQSFLAMLEDYERLSAGIQHTATKATIKAERVEAEAKKKATAKKAPVKKATAKKAPVKKTTAKKATTTPNGTPVKYKRKRTVEANTQASLDLSEDAA